MCPRYVDLTLNDDHVCVCLCVCCLTLLLRNIGFPVIFIKTALKFTHMHSNSRDFLSRVIPVVLFKYQTFNFIYGARIFLSFKFILESFNKTMQNGHSISRTIPLAWLCALFHFCFCFQTFNLTRCSFRLTCRVLSLFCLVKCHFDQNHSAILLSILSPLCALI